MLKRGIMNTIDNKELLFLESIDTFKVRFEGGNSIDAELFVNTINHTIALVKESARAINPSAFLKLEIKTTKDGSFETIIDAVAKYSLDLINKDNARLACEIVAGYLAFLQIKQHLKGEEPKKIETKNADSIIINQDNQSIQAPSSIINNYFNNRTNIDNYISQIFNDLEMSDREGFVIEHGVNKVTFKKTDYKRMTVSAVKQQAVINTKKETRILKDCELIIKKPDLIGGSKWEMIFDRKIEVKIDDEEFIKQIRGGVIKISGGYRLVCDLKIITEIDEEYNGISVEYIVVKVYGIKNREEQLDLFN